MTINQIHYFITAARLLSFTKAAEYLYITQPSLSRQISALEGELNMQLFIRGNRYVRLTPAGTVLYKEFSDLYHRYLIGVENAENVNKGITGTIHIGILDGTYVGDFMPQMMHDFKEQYPDLNIVLEYHSFSELIDGLFHKTLDVVFTLQFNVEGYDNLIFDALEPLTDNIVLHKTHPLYTQETLSLQDFDGQDLIIISPNDLSLTNTKILPFIKSLKIAPNIHFAPGLQTAMLWAESAVGAAYLVSRNALHQNPDLRFVPVNSPWKTAFVICWEQSNYNASIPLICDYCKDFFTHPHNG